MEISINLFKNEFSILHTQSELWEDENERLQIHCHDLQCRHHLGDTENFIKLLSPHPPSFPQRVSTSKCIQRIVNEYSNHISYVINVAERCEGKRVEKEDRKSFSRTIKHNAHRYDKQIYKKRQTQSQNMSKVINIYSRIFIYEGDFTICEMASMPNPFFLIFLMGNIARTKSLLSGCNDVRLY